MDAQPPSPPEETTGAADRSGTVAEWLRALVRGEEIALVVLAALAGVMAGVVVAGIGGATHAVHKLLFAIPPNIRLSAWPVVEPWRALLFPALGGLLLGLADQARRRFLPRRRAPVDAIEANALHGGRMSRRESLEVVAQNIVSSGCGASVGLEGAYVQAGSGLASAIGRAFRLRRSDQRLLVGCGAAGAIAAGFGAPLTGAFYAFELVIGSYTTPALVPVLVASVAGDLVARVLGLAPPRLAIGVGIGGADWAGVMLSLLPGFAAGLAAIGLMQGASLVERAFAKLKIPGWARPPIAGAGVGALAVFAVPYVLASGHGALDVVLDFDMSAGALLALLLAKATASAISVGAGFRGGLFFASLLLGACLGRAMALLAPLLGMPPLAVDPTLWSLAGMAAFGAGVVGAPLAMAFLVLESTGSFGAALAVLPAMAAGALTVRRLFGYSFATWRFHLRGETIRSAHDIGWVRDMTAIRLMRRDVRTVRADMALPAFLRAFPLGSTSHVVAVDEQGRYAGIVPVAEAHAALAEPAAEGPPPSIAALLRHKDTFLLPRTNVRQAMLAFDAAEAEALVVVDGQETRRVIGLLTEAHLLRRYTAELDQRRRAEAGLA